jgi:hypothetical protein
VLTGVDDDDVRAIAMTLHKTVADNAGGDRANLTLRTDNSSAPSLTLESLFDAVSSPPESGCRWSLPGGMTLCWRVRAVAGAAA